MRLKEMIKKLPGIRNLVKHLSLLDDGREILEYENTILGQQLVDNRLAIKRITGEKINVVFVCHRPAVWSSLKTVYEAIKNDEHFNATIVAIPNKKEIPGKWLDHEIYESEGAEEFWKDYGCINGYDYETGEWLDLNSLKPDYVFFQQPYNITRCPAYKSWVVSKYAKICYVHYAGVVYIDDVHAECNPLDFMKNVSFYFVQNDLDKLFVEKHMKQVNNNVQICKVGFPRYDEISSWEKMESNIWMKEKRYRIVWTPRWTTNEGNCNFFTYKDKFVQYISNNNAIDFTFRPHPQAFKEWETTGELKEEERNKYIEKYNQNINLHIDTSANYFPMLYSSDCLITDRSTMMLDYFLTGKPIIYCTNDSILSDIYPLDEGVYLAHCWDDIEKIVNQLCSGSDPLKDRRKKLLNQYFFLPKEGAGSLIKENIKRDILKQN